MIVEILFAVFLVFLLIFIGVIWKERRNLYSGVFFILMGISFASFALFLIFKYSEAITANYVSYIIIQLLALGVLAVLVSAPIVVILLFFYSAAFILYREGFTFRNLLSLGVGIGLIGYIFYWPSVASYTYQNITLNAIYVYIGLVILYFICLASTYTISSVINMINLFPRKLDYVVVLGAGLIGERVTPLLASRIRKGIKIYEKNPGSKLIMSGGQGPDEVVSEAVAMKNYALEQGVKEEDIILEDKSTNTEQNIKFSHILMKENARFAIVTNYYHLFRALILARAQDIKCIGYGAQTKFYFSLNAFIREFIGYLYLRRLRHGLILGGLTLIYVVAVVGMELYYKYKYGITISNYLLK